ncbi:pyocin knob domain-containing protein [Photorhabdus asymbiotica]|uniref:pyocin knob domain-containing protein n=1 Tax=Photorhabdus asymbiotica TaxID=291112 RepID=UPI003DA70B24
MKNLGLLETVNLAKNAVPNSRKVNGKVLVGDINITSQDIFDGQAIAIPEKFNLNDYKTPGVYVQYANASAETGTNYPEPLAGSLIVLKAAGIIQRYFVYNSSRIYTRSLNDIGVWTSWAREYNTSNPPSIGNLGAYTKEECNSFYITNIRLGAEVQIGAGGVLEYHGPNVLTGFYNRDRDYSAETLYWSPIQFLKNGQWITIVRG